MTEFLPSNCRAVEQNLSLCVSFIDIIDYDNDFNIPVPQDIPEVLSHHQSQGFRQPRVGLVDPGYRVAQDYPGTQDKF